MRVKEMTGFEEVKLRLILTVFFLFPFLFFIMGQRNLTLIDEIIASYISFFFSLNFILGIRTPIFTLLGFFSLFPSNKILCIISKHYITITTLFSFFVPFILHFFQQHLISGFIYKENREGKISRLVNGKKIEITNFTVIINNQDYNLFIQAGREVLKKKIINLKFTRFFL